MPKTYFSPLTKTVQVSYRMSLEFFSMSLAKFTVHTDRLTDTHIRNLNINYDEVKHVIKPVK